MAKKQAFASETCGLRTVGAKVLREVLPPGERVIVSKNGMESKILAKRRSKINYF